jgi:hypothetical protein
VARSTRGWRKFDEISCEDGAKVPIRCNTETGEFMAEIPNPEYPSQSLAKFSGKDLNKVKAEAVAWLKDNATLQWEAIIVVNGASRWKGVRESSDNSLNLHYRRAYRAKRRDGSFLWKEFSLDGENESDDDEVKGKPGRTTSGPGIGEDSVVLPYTSERWSALRMISLLIKHINERLHALLDQGKLDDLLLSIAQRGAMALLPAPATK